MGVTVRDNPEESRFEARDGDELIGIARYEPVGGRVVLTHTEVDQARRGRGVGSALMGAVLDDLRSRGLPVLPVCPFARAFIDDHPAYGDLVHPDRDRSS